MGGGAAIPDPRSRSREHMEATTKTMGIEEVLTAPRSPWQNAFVERFIGSVRRECLDHVIVFNEAGLLRLMALYRAYYERSRTHLSLANDANSSSGRAGERWCRRRSDPGGRRPPSSLRTPCGLNASASAARVERVGPLNGLKSVDVSRCHTRHGARGAMGSPVGTANWP